MSSQNSKFDLQTDMTDKDGYLIVTESPQRNVGLIVEPNVKNNDRVVEDTAKVNLARITDEVRVRPEQQEHSFSPQADSNYYETIPDPIDPYQEMRRNSEEQEAPDQNLKQQDPYQELRRNSEEQEAPDQNLKQQDPHQELRRNSENLKQQDPHQELRRNSENLKQQDKHCRCIVVCISLSVVAVIGVIAVTVTTVALSKSAIPATSLAKPSWTTWAAWADCDVTCGGGQQLRERTCNDPLTTDNITCIGQPTEQQQCADWKCPDCNFNCPYGNLNAECNACECEGSVMTGRVMDKYNRPLSGANISYSSSPYRELVTTNSIGMFEVYSVCADERQRFIITKTIYMSMDVYNEIQSSSTSSLAVTLQRLELPYISGQPQHKMRKQGESVRLCCSTNSTIKKFEWFRNGDIIANQESLVIEDLSLEDAGIYTCRVENEMGALYSEPATLTVIDTASTGCSSEPDRLTIPLPSDCVQPDTNVAEFDIGTCGQRECLNTSKTDQTSCTDPEHEFSCCQPINSKMMEINCDGYRLPVSKVVSCGCRQCMKQRRKIIGRVVKADSGDPLDSVVVYYNHDNSIRTSPAQGIFTLYLPDQVRRVVLTLKDEYFKRVMDTTVVFNIGDSLVTFHLFRMKQIPSVPLTGNSSEEMSLPLGDDGTEQVAKLVIAPNAMYNSSGGPHLGLFNVTVMNIDMRNAIDAAIAPGDFTTVDVEGNLAQLKSYGMFAVSLTDMAGNPLSVGGSSEVIINQNVIPCGEESRCDASLWVLNERSGLWEMASSLHATTGSSFSGRTRRQGVVVRGEMDLTPSVMYNIDAFDDSERCWAKVIAYNDDQFNPTDILQNSYMVTSIIQEEGNAFLRRSSANAIRRNMVGVCVAQACDSANPQNSRFTTYLNVSNNGRDLTPAAYPNSSPNFSLDSSDINRLQYKTTDNQIEMKPSASSDGPVYDGKSSGFTGGECDVATTKNKHLQFSFTEEGDRITRITCFNTVPSVSLNPTLISYLTFYPLYPTNQQYCFIGIRIRRPNSNVRIIVTSAVGAGTELPGDSDGPTIYGRRELSVTSDVQDNSPIEACMEYKCSGDLYNPRPITFDVTQITIDIKSQIGKCNVTEAASKFKNHMERYGMSIPVELPFSLPDERTFGVDSGLHIRPSDVVNMMECGDVDPYSPQSSNTDNCQVPGNGFIPAIEITCA